MIFILFLGNVKAPLTAKAVAGHQGVLTLLWTHLAKVLSERGVYISGWPFGVEFLDEIKKPPGKKSQGLKDPPTASMQTMVIACEKPYINIQQNQYQWYMTTNLYEMTSMLINLLELAMSQVLVIIGAPPASTSKFSAAQWLFANGTCDYHGPPHPKPSKACTTVKQKGHSATTHKAHHEVISINSQSLTPPGPP